jgi:DivIVA domain-containing protein
METTGTAKNAIDAIDSVSFKVGLKGYNVDEVDNYLERLSVEIHQLQDQLNQSRRQLRQAADRINQLGAGEADSTGQVPVVASAPVAAPVSPVTPASAANDAEAVSSMIVMAQRFVEQSKVEAETKAQNLTNAAQARAREIVNEARSRAEDEVTRLNGLKQRLTEDIDVLDKKLDSERGRLLGVVTEFSSWLDGRFQLSEGIKPAEAVEVAPTPVEAPVEQTTAYFDDSDFLVDEDDVVEIPARPVGTPPPAQSPVINVGPTAQVLPFSAPETDYRS